MRYFAIPQGRARVLLDGIRSGKPLSDDDAELRGEGKSLPKGFTDDLRRRLVKLKCRFPSVLGIRDSAGGRFEREACVVVHQSLPSADPQMLADYDFWTWLSLELRELVDWRHGGKERIAHEANFGIGKREENLLYRLWLRADIGHSSASEYELARRGDQDFWRSHIFRQDYGKCQNLIHALIRLQFPTPGGKPRWGTEQVRAIAKRLRRVNATLIFEALDATGAEALVSREAAAIGEASD